MEKVGRNDPCPCGSGLKFKKCCENKASEPKKFSAQLLSSGGDNTANRVNTLSKLFQRPPVQADPESSGNA